MQRLVAEAEEAPPPGLTATPSPTKPTPPPLDKIEKVSYSSIEALPGISANIAKQMREAGVETIADIAAMTPDDLMELRGVGETRAEMILEAAREQLNGQLDDSE